MVSLVLETVESGAAVRDLVDVLAHDTDSVIDLLLNSRSPLVSWLALSVAGTSVAAGDVRVVGLIGHCSE